MNMKSFIHNEDVVCEDLGNGVKRKVICFDEKVMMVKVEFQTGAVGALHQHYHVQMTHVENGSFEVEIDGTKDVLKAGDVFYVPSYLWHGVVCLEAGTLLDIFSPMREDFIKR